MNKSLLCALGIALAGSGIAQPADAVEIGRGVLTVPAKATKVADIDAATPGKQVNVGVYHSALEGGRGIQVFVLDDLGAPKDKVYQPNERPSEAAIDGSSLVCDFADGRAIIRGLKRTGSTGPFLAHVWATPKPEAGRFLTQSRFYDPGEFLVRGTGEKLEGGVAIPAGEGNEDRFFNGAYLKSVGYRGVTGFPATLPFPIRTSFRLNATLGQFWWDDIGWPGEVYTIETTDVNLEQYSSQVAGGGDPLWLERTWTLGASNELDFRQIQGYFVLDGELYLFGEATGGMDPWGYAIDPRPAYMAIDWDFANGPVNRMIVVDKA